MLLVADNACGAAQVEALIPARSEHRLLVTSREAIAAHQQAAALYRELGDRDGEAGRWAASASPWSSRAGLVV